MKTEKKTPIKEKRTGDPTSFSDNKRHNPATSRALRIKKGKKQGSGEASSSLGRSVLYKTLERGL